MGKSRITVECAFGKLKGQWRTLKEGLRTETPKDWKTMITCCCVLHNITTDIGGQGWDWDSGVAAGSDGTGNPDALRSDPHHAGLPSPTDRPPDDDSMKPCRNAALQPPKLHLGI